MKISRETKKSFQSAIKKRKIFNTQDYKKIQY